MAEDVAELLAQALRLSPEARAALANSILESLDTEIDEDAGESWRAEITRRTRELDAGAVQTIPWDDVRHQLRGRFVG